jgi:hypothetical protein
MLAFPAMPCCLAARPCSPPPPPPQVPLGSRVQLLVQDFDRCQRQQREVLRSLVAGLQPCAARDPAQYGLLGYSCAQLPHDDSQLVEEIWPQVSSCNSSCGMWCVCWEWENLQCVFVMCGWGLDLSADARPGDCPVMSCRKMLLTVSERWAGLT